MFSTALVAINKNIMFETHLTFSHIVINLSKMQRELLQILQIKKMENKSA